MIKIKKQNDIYEIGKQIAFISSWDIKDCNQDKINLMPNVGVKNVMTKQKIFKINFPWEYDKNGIYIKAYEHNWELNYAIVYDNTKLALIQSSSIIENVEIDNVDKWLFMDEKVADSLDKLEIKGKQINLTNL